MQYTINLQAGQELRQAFIGTTLVLLDLGAASAIDLEIEVDGYGVEQLRGVKRGLRVTGPTFTGARFRSAVDTTIEVVASAAAISVNYTEGATVNATIAGPLPLPVVNDRGAPGNPVNVVGITYSDAPATAIVDRAAVAVTSAGASILAASAGRKRARFANLGPDPVTLGTTGHTWAKRCIVLEAGDVWIESDAANLAWTAITDTGTTASVTAQEVNA
jgi:hypothetical protein